MPVEKGVTARHRAGIQDFNYNRMQKVADRFCTVILIRCVNPDNVTLNQAGYETKGFHIKAKSCNFGPMREFIAADPLLSKQSFKKDGWKKQKKYLDKAFEDEAETIGLTLPWKRIKELLKLKVIKEDKISPVPAHLKASDEHPHRKTIAYNATFTKSAGRAKIDRAINSIADYVYYLTTDDENWNDPRALYQVYYSPSGMLPKHTQRLMVLTNPQVQNDFTTQQSIIGLEAQDTLMGRGFDYDNDYLRAVIADYDLFGTWTNYEDDYKKHYIHDLRFDDYLKRFRRCVPGKDQIYDSKNIGTFAQYEDIEMGNLSANLAKIIRAINETDKTNGGAVVNPPTDDIKKDWRLRKYMHHSDEAGRPCLDDMDLPIYAIIPKDYSITAGGSTELYMDDVDSFVEFAVKFCNHGKFLVEFNPGWRLDISQKLKDKGVTFNNYLPIPGGKIDNIAFQNNKRRGVERIKLVMTTEFVGKRLADSTTRAGIAPYGVNEAYYIASAVDDVKELRDGTLEPDRALEAQRERGVY